MRDKIKRVVLLMLENRGFDHLMGWLYDSSNPPRKHIPDGGKPFYGLDFVNLDSLSNKYVVDGKIQWEQKPVKGTANVDTPSVNPDEKYHGVNQQLFGRHEGIEADTTPEMLGFVQSYAEEFGDPVNADKDIVKRIMECYDPSDLPILSGLSRFYSVSDMWFSSVPTQTNANRAFLLCGTSCGLVDNAFLADNYLDRKTDNLLRL
jgi:phospholipase C